MSKVNSAPNIERVVSIVGQQKGVMDAMRKAWLG
jgi:hypothetical protein